MKNKKQPAQYQAKYHVNAESVLMCFSQEDFASKKTWRDLLRELTLPIRNTKSILIEIVYARQYGDDIEE